jgi:hypothetical protein
VGEEERQTTTREEERRRGYESRHEEMSERGLSQGTSPPYMFYMLRSKPPPWVTEVLKVVNLRQA